MKRKILWGALAITPLIIAIYFSLMEQNDENHAPTFAEIEPMVNVCKEDSFLKCTNKNKKECENAINLSASYCDKKLDEYIDWNNIRDSMNTNTECIYTSLVAYFDDDAKNFSACFSQTEYGKRIEKTMNEMVNK